MADNKKIICESQEVLYQKAIKKMNADRVIIQHAYKIENYLVAAGMFEEVGDFEDAPQLASRCRQLAEKTKEEEKQQKYETAMARIAGDPTEDIWKKTLEMFESLGEYEDAPVQAEKCRVKLREFERAYKRKRNTLAGSVLLIAVLLTAGFATGFFKYVLGWGMLKGGMYSNAQKIFESKPGFLAADSLAQACRNELLREAKPGSEFSFGRYQWKVLDRENEIVTALTSAVGADHDFYAVPFDENGNADWETASLREWLNTTILEEAFSDMEQGCLLPIDAAGSVNAQYETAWTQETQDYLTILSAEETEKYSEILSSLGLNYWLRTPGHDEITAAYMSAGKHEPMLYGYPMDSDEIGVRALIRIDCSKLTNN